MVAKIGLNAAAEPPKSLVWTCHVETPGLDASEDAS